MSSPTKSKHEELLGLTLNEAKLIILGVICSDNSGKVDIDKIAQKGNYKNNASAGTSYRAAKRKLLELHPPSQQNASAATLHENATELPLSTPKKTKGRPKKMPTGESTSSSGGGGDEDATPSKPKRQKKTPAKSTPTKAVKVEIGDSDNELQIVKRQSTPDDSEHMIKSEPGVLDLEPIIKPMPTIKTRTPTLPAMQASGEADLRADLDIEVEFNAMERQKMAGVKPKLEPESASKWSFS